MSKITPCLWVEDDLQEIVDYYASIFPNVRLESINEMPDGSPITATFEIEGQRFMALRGGPDYTKFTEAVSFYLACADQAEVDHYWQRLTADGGEESQCGWLKDKFGLSWQIVPEEFEEMMEGDPAAVRRMIDAMMQMQRLDVAKLKAAYDGV
jgi:predicted 3-demethylubiquinone-9 3-methyltransferase (glyoxalase superfamily)